jgi:hypothetical protein
MQPDEFPSALEFVVGLERYAFQYLLPVREGVTVCSVEQRSTDDAVSVATR